MCFSSPKRKDSQKTYKQTKILPLTQSRDNPQICLCLCVFSFPEVSLSEQTARYRGHCIFWSLAANASAITRLPLHCRPVLEGNAIGLKRVERALNGSFDKRVRIDLPARLPVPTPPPCPLFAPFHRRPPPTTHLNLTPNPPPRHQQELAPLCENDRRRQELPFSFCPIITGWGGSGTELELETGTVRTVLPPGTGTGTITVLSCYLSSCTETQKNLFAKEPPEQKTRTARTTPKP